MPGSRAVVALAAALTVAAGLTACEPTGQPTEDANTAELQDQLAAVPGVTQSRVRHSPGDYEYLSIDLELGAGTHALATAPVIEVTQDLVEGSEYRDTELMVSLRWGEDDQDLRMYAHGPSAMLSALSNETRAMAVLEQHGFEETTLSVSDTAVDAQYRRSIDVGLGPGTPGRALNRVREAVATQLPDAQQETDLSVRYYGEYDPDRPTDTRSLRVPAAAPDEIVALADAYLRQPVPVGWAGATDVHVSVSGSGADVAGWYISVDVTVAPESLWSTPEGDLESHAGDDVVMDVGHHAARTVVPTVADMFLDLRLESADGYVDVAGFYSADCAAAWEDGSGRSRALWRTWVEAGGRPDDGATATECPDA
ncbi:hypothetical protein [Georgenia daeguensis]|uniref:hypothetical protein n=1 Tax=Georgenia daeguensis TaxID=908355 RepID=UPI0031E692A7